MTIEVPVETKVIEETTEGAGTLVEIAGVTLITTVVASTMALLEEIVEIVVVKDAMAGSKEETVTEITTTIADLREIEASIKVVKEAVMAEITTTSQEIGAVLKMVAETDLLTFDQLTIYF